VKTSLDILSSVLSDGNATGVPLELALCDWSSAATAYHLESREPAFFAIGCRRYSCEICGKMRRRQLINRIKKAEPNRFVTLSVHRNQTIDEAEKNIRKAMPKLAKLIRKEHSHEFEYVRMLEHCRDGYPHFHLLARSNYIPQKWLSTEWEKLTGARVVDIRKAHGKSTGYIAKYINKARDAGGVWTRQRMSVTHHFWPSIEPVTTEWIEWFWPKMPAREFAIAKSQEWSLERIRPGLYWIQDREPGDELPVELMYSPPTEQAYVDDLI